MNNFTYSILFLALASCSSCKPDPVNPSDPPYVLKVPSHFPQPDIPSDNLLTVNKVALGRMLFYDAKISQDLQIACANCHKQEFGFGSNKKLDIKVNHGMTTRNSSTLFNLAFTKSFFWDGRTKTLEETCLDAMKGEQNFNIQFVIDRLMTQQIYKDKFQAAFGTTNPTEDMVVKSLASFIRTMVSGSSRVDKGIQEGNINKYLTAEEIEGLNAFRVERSSDGGDCFHCHGDPQGTPMMTDNLFHNNGLDTFSTYAQFIDLGLGKVTGFNTDNGRFKTPPVRNLSYTAPYMHDGRIATLDMVLGHYNKGVKQNINLDPNMKHVGGLNLMPDRIARLKAFLLALDDPSFIQDTTLKSPF